MGKKSLVAATLLLVVGLALTVRTIAQEPGWRNSIDFAIYLESAKSLAAGTGAYPHNPNGMFFNQPGRDPFAYPPGLSWFFVALLPLGDTAIRAVWTLAICAAFVTALAILARPFTTRPLPWIVLALGLTTIARFGRLEIHHGQVNWLLLLFIVFGVREYLDGRIRTTALFWGAALAVKPFCGALVAWLIWKREYKAAALSAAFGLGIVALSLAATPESWQGFRDALAFYAAPEHAGGRPDNFALHGVWARLFAENPFTTPWVVAPELVRVLDMAGAAMLGGAFMLTMPRRKPSAPRAFLEIGTVMLGAATLGPLTNGSHLWLTLPGLAGAWLMYRGDRSWLPVALGWSALFALRLSPVKTPLYPDGNAWVPSSGLAVLFTAWQAALMVGVLGVTLVRLRAAPAKAAQKENAAPA